VHASFPTMAVVLLALLTGLPRGAVAQAASAQPTAPARPDLDARLAAQFTPERGLTADPVAQRAAATSFDVRAREAERRAPRAAADQALAAYLPHVSGLARYVRLSEIDPSSAGTVVAAPGVPPGPIPNGTPLVNVPIEFRFLFNQYTVQGSLQVPLSDYLLRFPQAHAAATRNQQAAILTERATRLKVAPDARATYYGWVRARLQIVVAEQALEQARGHLSDARAANQAGTASRADVLRVESQVAAAELLLVRTRNLA